MLIYKITNEVNNKVYIGQTTKSFEERIYQHKQALACGCTTHIYNAMRKYGVDKFHFEIIHDNIETKDELNYWEQHYIQQYDSYANGYNMTLGGESNPMFSEKSKKKHDEVMRSDDVRSRISTTIKQKSERGELWSDEARARMSAKKKALYSSPEGDIARAKFRKSFKFTPEHFYAINSAKFKSVYCIDESGNVVQEFESVKAAAEWWFPIYATVRDTNQLCDRIKESYKYDKYIKGLKWIYRV